MTNNSNLMSDWFSGTIGPEGFERLQVQLGDDPAAAARFARLSMLEVHLRERFEFERLVQAGPGDSPSAVSLLNAPVRLPERWQWLNQPRSLSVMVAGLFVAIVVLSLALARWPVENAANIPAGPSRHDYVARLIDFEQVVWNDQAEQATPHRGDDLLVGQVLDLQNGTAEVRFDGGARVVLAGRCRFRIDGEQSGRLFRGQLAARVEKPGGSFVVETPLARVTDLGTEFGIIVAERSNDVVVREGRVAVEWGSGVSAHHRELGAGEQLRLEQSAGGEIREVRPLADARSIAWQVRPRPIQSVSADSIHKYRLVPGGLHDGARSHTDREYVWTAAAGRDFPEYLIGADYIRTAMEDKANGDLLLTLTAGMDIRLYLLVRQHRDSPPAWVRERFTPTGDVVGSRTEAEVPLVYEVWQREVAQGEVIVLREPQHGSSGSIGTYGIAAVAIDREAPIASDDVGE